MADPPRKCHKKRQIEAAEPSFYLSNPCSSNSRNHRRTRLRNWAVWPCHRKAMMVVQIHLLHLVNLVACLFAKDAPRKNGIVFGNNNNNNTQHILYIPQRHPFLEEPGKWIFYSSKYTTYWAQEHLNRCRILLLLQTTIIIYPFSVYSSKVPQDLANHA